MLLSYLQAKVRFPVAKTSLFFFHYKSQQFGRFLLLHGFNDSIDIFPVKNPLESLGKKEDAAALRIKIPLHPGVADDVKCS